MTLCRVVGGEIYDPVNGIDGATMDLWIESGKFVAPPEDPSIRPSREIDARGYIVFPGGVDMHCHIAGPKVNVARKMRPEERRSAVIARGERTRSGSIGSVPSSFTTGYLYAGLGYTTAIDAAVAPLFARHCHEEFADTPILDKGFLALVGNNHYILRQIREREPDRLEAYCAWLLSSAKAFGLKAVNPGGVEEWKEEGRKSLADIDQPVEHFQVTPRQILAGLAATADRLRLPHPLHVHANNLGIPGNWRTTLETMKALDGHRAHLAHIQFHSYIGGPDDETSFGSAAADLVEYVRQHPNLTVDVGHVSFGSTTSLTGDGPLGYYLHRVTGNKWFSGDTEMETGCGVVPIEYRDKNLINSIQWAIGLEWYLLMDDPWRIALSTDHPNGGSFLRYPETIHLLMDASYRREMMARVHPKVRSRTVLGDLEREYSLYEIALITRASPARILGLEHKGHLGVGADADITIYRKDADIQRMFEFPRYLIRRGAIVADDGEIRLAPEGQSLLVEPEYDHAAIPHIRDWFESHYTVEFANYPVRWDEVSGPQVISPSTQGSRDNVPA